MKTAVIYARYSSERQTEQSIEGQISTCNEFAKKHDIIIVDTYIDRAMTGKNDHRRDFQRMLKDSYRQAWDYVIVYKLDRFSRNKYEIAIHKKTLKDNGIKVLSAMENIPDTPEGIILESLLEGMAEYYSAELSQKVSRGLNENRKKGLHTGGEIIFGYKVIDKKIYIDEDQAEIVKYIYEQYASGAYVKDIIIELANKGIYRHGKPFAENTIYRLLRNEKYIGIFRHGDEVFTNIYPPILDETLFKVVQAKNEANKFGKHISEIKYLLKGKMYCGSCGNKYTSDSGTSGKGIVSRYYKCRGRKKKKNICTNNTIRKEPLEDLITQVIINTLKDKSILSELADKVIERNKNKLLNNTELNLLNKEKVEIHKALDNLINSIELGIITKTTKSRIEELEKKLELIESNIIIEKSKAQLQITKQEIIKFIKHALTKSNELLIRLLIDKIIIHSDKIEIYFKYTNNPKTENNQSFLFAKSQETLLINPYKFGQTEQINCNFNIFCYI